MVNISETLHFKVHIILSIYWVRYCTLNPVGPCVPCRVCKTMMTAADHKILVVSYVWTIDLYVFQSFLQGRSLVTNLRGRFHESTEALATTPADLRLDTWVCCWAFGGKRGGIETGGGSWIELVQAEVGLRRDSQNCFYGCGCVVGK